MLARLLLIALLAGTCAMAQDEPPGGGGGGRGGGGGGMGGGGPMMQAVRTPLDIMTESMKLTGDQKKHLKSVFDETATEAVPVRDQLLAARDQFAAAVAAGKSADELKPMIDQQSLLMAQMSQIEAKAFAKIFGELSQEQKQAGAQRVFYSVVPGIFMKKKWNSTN